jgi:hypothetical protein
MIKSNMTHFVIIWLNPTIYASVGAENYKDSLSVDYYYVHPSISAYNEATATSLHSEICSVGIVDKGGVRN